MTIAVIFWESNNLGLLWNSFVTWILGPHWNWFIEAILMSTHNLCFEQK